MAAGTIAFNLFHLYDNWPGVVDSFSVPQDGFTGASHHNVETPAYRYGQKIQVWNDGSSTTIGPSTFVYLQVGTQASAAIAAKLLCVPDSATLWYQVTNDAASCVDAAGGVLAVALSAMTDGYWGWFWCGGVCPKQYVAALTGNFITKDVVAGPMSTVAETSVVNFTVATTLKGHVGYALTADT